MKRLFDVVVSAIGLLALAPILAAISATILVLDGRPIFFRQARIGHRGQPFRMWKFRTMVRDAERRGKPLTVSSDPRITRLGHWLRNTKLDELPQLINVLVGDMSFVGPRPEVEQYVNLYTADQCRVLDLVPGITDAASIHYRHESELLRDAADPERLYVERIIPDKIRLNLAYASEANLLRDCRIIFQTLAAIGRR